MLKSWKFWAGILLLGGLIWLVEDAYGWQAVLASWQSIPPLSLALALGLMLISYLLRAVRFYDFFNSNCQGHFSRLLRVTVLHNFFNNMLPMRSGETAFPLLMKQHFGVPYRHSGPALLWLRLLDLYALLLLAAFSLQDRFPVPESLRYPVMALLAIAPLAVLPLQNAVNRFLANHPKGWANKAAELMHALPKSPWPFVRALFWTLINWALKVAVYAWLLSELLSQFQPVPFTQSWMGATTGELSSVLPIHGVAGAGTYEAGILAGLLPWGIDSKQALGAAVNLHLFVLGTTLLLTALITLLTQRHRHARVSAD
ncbi:lysylphosphatidylglycerol synthase transmembrane domain-containing protein [Thalassolituus sp. LLYu03]|uniref:lysylphosphatidylglycerol synthase transmembrane domain-containing protein n=1 Tax=Thalassolituus sp. LLYu03 TaxID=3421656 RepID=UPI003D2AD187